LRLRARPLLWSQLCCLEDAEEGCEEDTFAQAVFRELPPEELLCPICLEVMTLPVALASCGHAFCHACVGRHVDCTDAKRCPLCRCDCKHSDLRPAQALRDAIGALLVACRHHTAAAAAVAVAAATGGGGAAAGGLQGCPCWIAVSGREAHESVCPLRSTA
jgi:hypothetical protein